MKTRLLPEHLGLGEKTSHHPSWGAISLLRAETAEHTAWGTESEEKVLGTLQDYAYEGTLTTPEEDALGGHAYWPHSVSACVYWGARVCDARGELLGVSSFTRCGSKTLPASRLAGPSNTSLRSHVATEPLKHSSRSYRLFCALLR